MDIISMAKEISKKMAQSKEYNQLKKYEKEYNQNDDTKKLIKDYNSLQDKLNMAIKHKNKELEMKIRKDMAEIYNDISNNDTIKNLQRSLNDFINLRKEVEQALDSYIEVNVNDISRKVSTHKCGGCGGCGNSNKTRF